MHIFIEGRNGSGMSRLAAELVARAAEEFPELFPAKGYHTWYRLEPETNRKLIYISRWGEPEVPREEQFIGTCKAGCPRTRMESLERFAPVLDEIGDGSFAVFDEIGIMEERAPGFMAAAEAALDRRIVVLGVMRDIDSPYLNRFRSRADVRILPIPGEMDGEQKEQIYRALAEQLAAL